MIGVWQTYADIYLIVAGLVMLVTFGLPLLFAPMWWARLFRWEVPPSQKLTIFLGRSVGVFIIIMGIFAVKAAQNPADMPFFYDLFLWIIGGMVLLHAYSAIRKTQPITETLEIIMWVVLGLITLGFYPQS